MAEIWKAILQFKHTPLIFMALLIIAAVVFYRFVTRRMRRFAVQHAFKAQNALTFFFVWRYAFMFAVVVLVIIGFGESLGTIGITLAFVSALFSWGVRNPIMNLAAWLMIVLRRPYRIGDRVILGGITGDVKDITMTYTVLEQVGGTVSGEEKSGRGVMIPNLHLFNWTVINYTADDKYILDEAPVRLTYDSNIDLAEQIMICHAWEATADAIQETGEQPYVRFELIPSGVIGRVRYRVLAVDRQKSSTEIVNGIFKEFSQTEGIRFAHVTSDASFVPRDGQPPPPPHPQWLEDGLIRPWFSATRPTVAGS
jgi:small-conductance mechanosensitive channel